MLTEFPFCAGHWGYGGGEADPILLLYEVRKVQGSPPPPRSQHCCDEHEKVLGSRGEGLCGLGVSGPVSAEGTFS